MKYTTRKNAHWGTILAITVVLLSGLTALVIAFLMCFEPPEGIILTIFGTIFLGVGVLLYLQSYAWYTYYDISLRGLLLRGVYNKQLISFADIEEVQIIDEEQTRKIVDEYMDEMVQHEAELDFGRWFKSGKKASRLTKFCSFQFIHKTKTYGVTNIQYEGSVATSGDFVLLKLKGGELFILSPKDPKGFVDDVNNYLGSD